MADKILITTYEEQGVAHFQKVIDPETNKEHCILVMGDTPVDDVVKAKSGLGNGRQRMLAKVELYIIPAVSVDVAPDLGGTFTEGSEPKGAPNGLG